MTPWPALLLLLLPAAPGAGAIRWLSLMRTASILSIDNAELCPVLEGLSRRQVKICVKNVEVMDSVRNGAQRAVLECQWQFKYQRWNCMLVNGTNLFGKITVDGTKEVAFLHAISAAGVAHAVTRACSSGHLVRCGCDRTVRGPAVGSFQWSGCSDNVAYGTAFSKSFVDANYIRLARGRKGARALMNLHNNEVGRKVIETNMKVDCKCHGVSGSCETKTCWRAMPSFREVGLLLKKKFDSASAVNPEKVGKRIQLVRPDSKSNSAELEMVYMDSSPDFCEPNGSTGTSGTRGRVCNRGGVDCDLLCCGRGHTRHVQQVTERCHCKFHWCCYVECKECTRQLEISKCL